MPRESSRRQSRIVRDAGREVHEKRPATVATSQKLDRVVRVFIGRQGRAADRLDVGRKGRVADDYLGIFFSGGRAPEYIRDNEHPMRITRHFFETNKPIASVPHGVEIAAEAGCVRGRGMVLPNASSTWKSAAASSWTEPCVVDRQPDHGRTYHDHGAYVGV